MNSVMLIFSLVLRRSPLSTPFPYTTLFRSCSFAEDVRKKHGRVTLLINNAGVALEGTFEEISLDDFRWLMNIRSEEHTSELQSRENLVCRLLLEKKKRTCCF